MTRALARPAEPLGTMQAAAPSVAAELLALIPDVPVWEIDAVGRVTYLNPAAEEMLGVTCHTAGDDHFLELIAEHDRTPVLEMFGQLLSGTIRTASIRFDLAPAAGGRHVAVTGAAVLDADGSVASIVGVTTDITLEHDAERRLLAMVEMTSEIITIIGANGTILFQSRSIEDVLGRRGGAPTGDHMFSSLHPDDLPRAAAAFRSITGTPGATVEIEVRARHDDGSWRVLAARAVNRLDDRVIGGIVVSSRDVTEAVAAREAVEWEANHDHLTRLPNRRSLGRVLDGLRRSEAEAGLDATVLMVGLDRFAQVNASLGYAVGDQVLVRVASALVCCSPESAFVGRFAGDCFVVVLDGSEHQDLEASAQKLLGCISQPIDLDGRAAELRASIGIARAQKVDELETVVQRAESAMRLAKRDGGNRAIVSTSEAVIDAALELQLESDLREALRAGELEVHYQPEVDPVGGRVVAYEALARWTHPTHGRIGPDRFIPLAERSDLIVGLGGFVLRTACADAVALHGTDADAPAVAVNVAARQLVHPGFVATVEEILAASGLPASRLCLEVTESSVATDIDTAIAILDRLRELGVRTALDDFGTGYSSLSHLKRLRVDIVKIDRSFVTDLERGNSDSEIVKAIIAVAASLGLQVVAEGVETDAQLGQLIRLGCRIFQGYYWSRPLPVAEVPALERRLGIGSLAVPRAALS